jgi:hypothetical protein
MTATKTALERRLRAARRSGFNKGWPGEAAMEAAIKELLESPEELTETQRSRDR